MILFSFDRDIELRMKHPRATVHVHIDQKLPLNAPPCVHFQFSGVRLVAQCLYAVYANGMIQRVSVINVLLVYMYAVSPPTLH